MTEFGFQDRGSVTAPDNARGKLKTTVEPSSFKDDTTSQAALLPSKQSHRPSARAGIVPAGQVHAICGAVIAGNPSPSAPLVDLTKPRRSTWLFDRYGLVVTYYRRILRGKV